jgi:Brp/Blh family beta-carotene 15,15'-monooxygenase
MVSRTPPASWSPRRRRLVILETVAVIAVTTLLHPLLGFAVYLTCLHSVRHVCRVWKRLAVRLRPGRAAAVLALVCSLTAAGTLLGGQIVAAHTPLEWWRVILVGLAALTAPHAVVVVRALRSPGARTRFVSAARLAG